MIIAISGISTTGKSTVARALAKKLKYKLVDLHALAEKINAFIGYDRERKSKIVSVYRLKKEIEKMKKKWPNMIIEGIFAHEFPADICIILRCRPDVLEKRLKKRFNWPTKIYENLLIEMEGTITKEALYYNKNVFEIDVTSKSTKQIVKDVESILGGKGNMFRAGKIKW